MKRTTLLNQNRIKNVTQMKNVLFLFILLFAAQGVHSQTQTCKINGILTNELPYKYAYLYTAKTKKLMVTPILNNKFNFEVAKQNDVTLGILFLGLDSLKTYQDVLQNGIGSNYQSKMVALEDLEITIAGNINLAAVKGGSLNSDLEQMTSTSKSLEFKQFFIQHPDSPISLIFLKSLTTLSKQPMFAQLVDCKSYYNDLSDRLKNSSEGKEVWAKIND